MDIADEEIVHYKGESSGVGVVAEKHGGRGFGVAVLGKEGDKTKLGQETRLGEARDSLKNITYGRVCRGSDGGKEGGQVL